MYATDRDLRLGVLVGFADALTPLPELPAAKSSGTRAWYAAQLAKRRAFIRALAERLSLDPDEAVARLCGEVGPSVSRSG